MNEGAHAALQAQIDRLRTLPDKLRKQAPDIAIDTLKTSLRETIAAGQAPDGMPWKKTKTGKTPLAGAYAALAFGKIGNGVRVVLSGPEALHHLGRAKGEIVRQVIPIGALPARIADRLTKKLQALFVKAFNG